MILDLFAGPRGWSVGLAMHGLSDVGIEWDEAACRTAAAAGFVTVRADVAKIATAPFVGRVDGLIGSPPCGRYSKSGKGSGRAVLDELADAIRDALAGKSTIALHSKRAARVLFDSMPATRRVPNRYRRPGQPRPKSVVSYTRAERWRAAQEEVRDAALVVQPARFIYAIRPRWIALEQVPDVLPLWRAMVPGLRALGYSVWVGLVYAEEHGVPQARRRAALIARLGGRPVGRPTPTHRRYDHRLPDGGRYGSDDEGLFGDGLLPWISMADGVGWGATARPAMTVTAGGTSTGGVEHFGNAARKGLERERDAGRWVVSTGNMHMKTSRRLEDAVPFERSVDAPAPTVDTKTWRAWRVHREGERVIAYRPGTRTGSDHRRGPLEIIGEEEGVSWPLERPSPTIVGSFAPDVIAAPGYRRPGDPPRQQTPGSVRVTLEEAALLQTFPPNYPFYGTKTKVGEQIGNAVPPLLAAAMVAEAADLPWPPEGLFS